MPRHQVSIFAKSPRASDRIVMEVDTDGIHQVLENRTGEGFWVRSINEPPPIRTEVELVDKLYQGANSHQYMLALLGAWAQVRKLRGQEVPR